jgi:hypothetical protein
MPADTKGQLDFMNQWYPIQVKQKDKAGRQDIDLFETAMTRAERTKGFFVSFDYTSDAMSDSTVLSSNRQSYRALTVRDILDNHIAHKLA